MIFLSMVQNLDITKYKIGPEPVMENTNDSS